MNKRILKTFLFLLVINVSYLVSLLDVKAITDSLINGEVVDVPYYYTHHRGTEYFWDSFRYIRRVSDGGEVYCLQPLVHIKNEAVYDVKMDGMADYINISEDVWKRIEKIAYYGYSYSENGIDHSDPKWYAAAQMMIWRISDPSVEVYFTNTIRGPRDDSILRDEINEIERLILEHDKIPNFKDFPTNMYIGDSLNITDDEGVLSKYTISNVLGGKVTRVGNTLNLASTYSTNNLKFTLTKSHNNYREPVSLYYSNDSQMAVRKGNIKASKIDYKVPILRGRIVISKKDYDTNTSTPLSPDASLTGALYGLFNMDGSKVMELTTGLNGFISSGYLSRLGDFYVQEIKPSKGYTLDNTKYKVTLSKENLYPTVSVSEKIIKRNVKLIKVYESGISQELKPEENVTFDFILKSTGKKYTSITTDENGEILISLPFGSYIVHQVNTITGYEKMEDFTIDVDQENQDDFIKYIVNKPIGARVKVVKKDLLSKEQIMHPGIKFRIKNVDTGNFVCENTACDFETNTMGEFYTAKELVSGHYELIEIDSGNSGYFLNNNHLMFEIDENMNLLFDDYIGKYIELTFYNEPIRGQIIIEKLGEELVLENGTYYYRDIPLSQVVFELKAREDILVNDKLLYKKGDIIETMTTDQDGKVKSSLLPLGKYTFQEIRSNGSNMLDKEVYHIDIVYDDTHLLTQKLNFKNFLPKGKLEFFKKDIDGRLLEGAEIEIYTKSGNLIFSGKTDKDGKIVIDDLPLLEYYLIEKNAPVGYMINTMKMEFEIVEHNDVKTLEMIDERIITYEEDNNSKNLNMDGSVFIPIEETRDEASEEHIIRVPDTLKMRNMAIEFLSFIIILLGVKIIIGHKLRHGSEII